MIDILIIIALIATALRGRQIGFVQQLFSTAGFFGGLFIGARIQPYAVNLVGGDLNRTFVTLVTTLGAALMFLMIGEVIGLLLKRKLAQAKLSGADGYLGAALSMVSVLIAVWLTASVVRGIPYPSMQQAFQRSYIVRTVSNRLPYAPDVIASLGTIINPNGFPQVFAGWDLGPPPDNINLPDSSELASAVEKTRASVVKIVGEGCGGIVDGSGYVAGSDLVVTNAHVVAGIQKQYVVDANGTHSATAVWFDPDLDLAILRVDNLAGEPLALNTDAADRGTAAAILGYPGGGAFTANPASVIQVIQATGRDIYNRNVSDREVYEIAGDVEQGNSGGPLINVDGEVIGVIFARSTTYGQVGYALTGNQVAGPISQSSASNRPVDTGRCT